MTAHPRCVLVDDDPDFMAFVRHCLDKACPSLEVVPFTSGLDAIGYLARHSTDLLITDFRMPFLDGLRLTRQVRAGDKRMPIVVMSGDEIGPQARAAGATAFVPKRDLLYRIGAVLERCGFGGR